MRVAPHVKLLRRAANVNGDRLERELRLVCRLGSGGLLGLGRLGGVLRGGRGVELRLRVGLGLFLNSRPLKPREVKFFFDKHPFSLNLKLQ